MSFSPPPTPAPIIMPQAPAAPPAFGISPIGQKPQAQSSQPTYLGAQLTASQSQQGTKTLLGT